MRRIVILYTLMFVKTDIVLSMYRRNAFAFACAEKFWFFKKKIYISVSVEIFVLFCFVRLQKNHEDLQEKINTRRCRAVTKHRVTIG